MRPTPRAIELETPIRRALNELELSLSSINFDPKKTNTLFRISISDDVAPLILPNLVSFIESNSPGSSLRIRSEQGSEAIRLLDSNNIDFAIGRFEMVPSRFGSINLFNENYVCMMNQSHKFANEKKLSIKQYLSIKHLRVAPVDAPVAPIDRSLSQLNLERNIFVRIDLITLAPSILANSDLVLTLPSETAKRMSKNYGFSISDLPIDLEKRQTKMLWHKELSNHPSFDWIRNMIVSDL